MTISTQPHFFSGAASTLYAFVESKRLDGYKYNSEVKELQRFDRFIQSLEASGLSVTEELLYKWLAKRPNESVSTFYHRNCVYRQFHAFAEKRGISFPIPPFIPKTHHDSGFTPYIFSHDEIRRIFEAIDTDNHINPAFRRCAPLLFRLLYGTGIRQNEALSLQVSDIILTQQLIVIRDGKHLNSRLTPMSVTLQNRVEQYLRTNRYAENEPVFQSRTKRPLRKNAVYDWFRYVLWKAGIPHHGRGKGPRLHDLRHTFAVHSLQNAVKNGRDVQAFLPFLSAYLGHQDIRATERYLRLTAEAYPEMLEALNQANAAIIPEVSDYED